jgi:hypothetical protein
MTKLIPLIMLCSFAVALSQQKLNSSNSTALNCTQANGKYCVYRETSSHVCRVSTYATTIGDEFKGPYSTRNEAVTAMCQAYVPGSGDDDKCAATVPDNACSRKGAKKHKQ